MAQSVRVITHIQVQAGKEEEAVSLLKELVAATRTEAGCLRYELLQNSVVAAEFVLLEEWQSEEDFNHHMQTPQVQEALLEGEMFLVHPPDIRRYQLLA
jgi:quinol monooxygenase YgiN